MQLIPACAIHNSQRTGKKNIGYIIPTDSKRSTENHLPVINYKALFKINAGTL